MVRPCLHRRIHRRILLDEMVRSKRIRSAAGKPGGRFHLLCSAFWRSPRRTARVRSFLSTVYANRRSAWNLSCVGRWDGQPWRDTRSNYFQLRSSARRQRISHETMVLATTWSRWSPSGSIFGRLANFINGELYGRPTTVPWAMQFPAELLDHPGEATLVIQETGKDQPSFRQRS